jgi:alginate O-acetyltransferase complex protein AlgJ
VKTSNIVYAGLLATWGASAVAINVKAVSNAAPVTFAELVDGRASSNFERNYRDAVYFRNVAQNGFGSLRYLAFGEGRKGVVVGKDGWLFTVEEIEMQRDMDARVDSHIEMMISTKEQLQRSGIDLIVALLPEKADIYSDKLKSHSDVPLPYKAIREQMLARGLVVPDLREAMLQQKDAQQLFLRTDTHWTPEGANLVAKTLADSLNVNGGNTYELTKANPKTIVGDLSTYLSIGFLKAKSEFANETISSTKISQATNDGADIFGDSTVPIVLVGTSYSANESWGFESVLKSALHSDILNFAEIGKGPFEPMNTFMSSATFKSNPPKYVLWEVPLRYFATSPSINSPHHQDKILSASVTP